MRAIKIATPNSPTAIPVRMSFFIFSSIIFGYKLQLFRISTQSSKGMKKGLHLLGEMVEENYSPINEVVSIAVL